MLLEILTEVPLLPLFGDFDKKEMSEDLAFFTYIISSLNNDTSIFEEIICERINNNYQIVKPKINHNDLLNKNIFNLKKGKTDFFKKYPQWILFNYSIEDFTT